MSGRKPSHDTPSATLTGYPPAFDFGQLAFQRWVNGMMAMTEEVSHFAQARLQEDMGTWAKLASCRDPREAFDCHCRFVEKATADYLDELGKLSRFATNMAQETGVADSKFPPFWPSALKGTSSSKATPES
jgi:Phasin protein